MNLIMFLYLCAALAMWGFTTLYRRQVKWMSWLIYAFATAFIVITAWLGWDFSPSFSMLFLGINLSLCAVGNLLWRCFRGTSFLETFCKTCPSIFASAGAVFAILAVYIYAAGDDWLDNCTWTGLAAGTVLCVMSVRYCWHRRDALSVGVIIELWLVLSAGCFTLFCGIRSVPLLPYAVGLLLFASARLIPKEREVDWAWCLWAGLLSASLFATLPALCPGGIIA